MSPNDPYRRRGQNEDVPVGGSSVLEEGCQREFLVVGVCDGGVAWCYRVGDRVVGGDGE